MLTENAVPGEEVADDAPDAGAALDAAPQLQREAVARHAALAEGLQLQREVGQAEGVVGGRVGRARAAEVDGPHSLDLWEGARAHTKGETKASERADSATEHLLAAQARGADRPAPCTPRCSAHTHQRR